VQNLERNYSFTRSYLRGEALFGFWNVVSKGLAAANAFLILSFLDLHSYGVYILVLSLYELFGGFFFDTLAGVVFSDVTRFIGEGQEEKAKKLFLENTFVRFGFAVILAASFLLGAAVIAEHYSPDVAPFLQIIAVLFLIEASYNAMKMLFQARLRYGLVAFRPIVYKSTKFFLLVGFLTWASFGIKEVLIAHVLATAIATLYFVPAFIGLYRPWRHITALPGRMLWPIVKTYGKWSLFTQFISQAVGNIEPWLIKFFVSTEAVALFSVADSLFGAIKTLAPNATLESLIPREAGNRARAAEMLLRGTKFLTIFGVLLALAGFFVFPAIIALVLPKYVPSLPLFYILLFALPFLGARMMSSTLLLALRRQRYLFIANSIKIVFTVVATVALLYFFGIQGLAFERVLTTIVVVPLMYGYLLRYQVQKNELKFLYTFDTTDRKLFARVYHGVLGQVKKIIPLPIGS